MCVCVCAGVQLSAGGRSAGVLQLPLKGAENSFDSKRNQKTVQSAVGWVAEAVPSARSGLESPEAGLTLNTCHSSLGKE